MNNVQLVGDPHLGRVFKNNVPLHRRGERERRVRQAFVQALRPATDQVENIVIMGDLFDAPQVSYETLWFAAGALRDAASNHPSVNYWLLQGNHDESRDLHEITAWNCLSLMLLRPNDRNLRMVTDPLVIEDSVFLPWSPRYSAVEMLGLAAPDMDGSVTKAYGHWDLDARGSAWNLIPTRELAAAGITEVWTGHIHKPARYVERGVTVNVVGSLQPYAHGEDGGQGDVRYITLSPNELANQDVTNACVRVILGPEDPIPAVPDCLQWQVERTVEGEDGEEFGVELTLDGFEVSKVYAETMDEAEILPGVRKQIDDKWNTIFASPSSSSS